MRLVALGAATVDRYYHVNSLPAADGGSFAREVTERFGGVAANVAYGAAKLGHDAAVRTRLGRDDEGAAALADLEAGPVDASLVRRGEERSTHCVILSASDGTRSIVTAGESTRAIRLDEQDREQLHTADAVFVTAYAPEAVHQQLLSWVGESFPPVVFDLSGPREELADRGASRASVEAWIQRAAIVVTGAVAARSAFDATGRAAARELRDRGVTRAAVTAGADGATLVPATHETDATDPSERSLLGVPAVAAETADETGAGDAYVAGLIHAWLAAGRSPREAGLFAAAGAALNCEAIGARAGMADERTIRAGLRDRARLE